MLIIVASRWPRLLSPLAQDLAEWRLASGRAPSTALIFPTHDCDVWKLHDWQNWRRRVYQPAAKAAGVTGDLRVYRLRGSFVSPLLWEGRSLTFVADQARHSVATLAKHYAGVLEELEDKPRIPAACAHSPDDGTNSTPGIPCKQRYGRCWARTSDLRLVETALSQLS